MRYSPAFALLAAVLFCGLCIQPVLAESADEWVNSGNQFIQQGRYQEALQAFENAIGLDSRNKYAWTGKSGALNNLGRAQESLSAAEIALTIDPNFGQGWQCKGFALQNLNRLQESLDAFNTALSIDSNNQWSWSGKSNILNQMGRSDEALQAAEKALSIDSGRADLWNSKGYALLSLGRYQESLDAFNAGLARDANNQNSQSGRLEALIKIRTGGQNILGVMLVNAGIAAVPLTILFYVERKKPVKFIPTFTPSRLYLIVASYIGLGIGFLLLTAGLYYIAIVSSGIPSDSWLICFGIGFVTVFLSLSSGILAYGLVRSQALPKITKVQMTAAFIPVIIFLVISISVISRPAADKGILGVSIPFIFAGLVAASLSFYCLRKISPPPGTGPGKSIPKKQTVPADSIPSPAPKAKPDTTIRGQPEKAAPPPPPQLMTHPVIPVTPKTVPSELADQYRDWEFISKGGFARVFKAKRKDGQEVAIKVPISLDKSTGKSFIAELQNWTKINHENIVRVYDFNIMPIPYFEMELCDSSLADGEKPIGSEEAAWILLNICEGLKFAHARKIIHRDLKPQNILLKNGVPKISDWGLSRVISESTSTTATSFTPYYAAPEQIANKAKDERTDIWQLGVIFYELVTGELPFTGDSMVEVMASIATKNPKQPSQINPSTRDVEPVILKCLEKDPAKRFQSVLELQKDLALYLRVTYTESLKLSVTAKDLRRSASYCGDLVMVNLLTGDMKSANKYLTDLVNYAEGDVKILARELSGQIRMRIEMGVTEIPDELIQKAEIIVHKVSVGFRKVG